MLPSIASGMHPVHFGETAYAKLNEHLKSSHYSALFIVTDSNTHDHCLSHFLERLETNCPIEILEVEPGEEHKNISTCTQLWHALSDWGADRQSLIINLGGGVVTDMGGFVAATYMRGIDFINIPTSLLAMVDASVGGKTGVDLGAIKNQVGVITDPVMVLIDSHYLHTLPKEHMRSGLAEIFKHALIADALYWEQLKSLSETDASALEALIYHSISIKNEVVKQDPKEKGLRKILNFGHTLGHAIESYFLQHEQKKILLHGEAIAIGMICESWLSTELCGLSETRRDEIKNMLLSYFPKPDITSNDFESILSLLRFDKKNSGGEIKFVLLEDIGKAVINKTPGKDLIINSLLYYLN